MPRPQRKAPPYDPDLVLARVRLQAGVVAAGQLAAYGVTDSDIARLVRRRVLRRLSRGVYTDQGGQLSPLQHAWWACLHYAGSGIADLSAVQLARDGAGTHLTLPIHVAVPAGRGTTPLPHVVLHRVARIQDLVVPTGCPPRMRAEHAALRMAAASASTDAVVAALADAVNWRATQPNRLRHALDDLPRLAQRQLVAAVVEDLGAGACSVLERGYLLEVERAHGLPAGERQVPRRSATGWEFRDVLYLAFGLVVELDGRLLHSGKPAWDHDHQRDLDDLVAGRDAVRLGYGQVFDTGCATAGKIGVLLQQRGWAGEPVRCGPDCSITHC